MAAAAAIAAAVTTTPMGTTPTAEGAPAEAANNAANFLNVDQINDQDTGSAIRRSRTLHAHTNG